MDQITNLINQLDSFIEGQTQYHAFSTYSYQPLKSLVSELQTTHIAGANLDPILKRIEGFTETQATNHAFRSHSYHALMNYVARIRLLIK